MTHDQRLIYWKNAQGDGLAWSVGEDIDAVVAEVLRLRAAVATQPTATVSAPIIGEFVAGDKQDGWARFNVNTFEGLAIGDTVEIRVVSAAEDAMIDENAVCSLEALMETNRRLSRRCQEAESTLAIVQRSVGASANMMRQESKRACLYANQLRDIYRHHRRLDDYWRECWNCRTRRWLRSYVWGLLFAMNSGKKRP